MSQLGAMHQAIEFIETHLQEEIAVADMAAAVSYSLYHFCRVFAQTAHHSPYDYLMRRRLSEAARELVETDKKITDIAFDYRFNSPETFARAFKRMFATQPSRWKKTRCLPPHCLLPPFSRAYLEHINRGDFLKPVLAQKSTLHLAGLMTLVQVGMLNPVAELWELWREIGQKNALGEKYYGVVWYPPGRQDSFFYMAAIETETSDAIPPDLVIKTVPASTYARFVHSGPWSTRQLTLDYIYQTWLPKSGRQLGGLMEIERYPAGIPQLEAARLESKIYVPLE